MLLALAAFGLRALVPVGFMPAAVGQGWFLQLCPQGMSEAAMAVLLGKQHHHHHHQTQGKAQSASPVQCELGGGVSVTLTVIHLALAPHALLQLDRIAPLEGRSRASQWPRTTFPRGPPMILT